MDNGLLQKYATRVENEGDTSNVVDLDAHVDLGAFGWLRGVRDRCPMLELRRKSGDILAVGYGWLERATFDPSEGITLLVAGQKVHIKGRNLNAEVRPLVRLFEGITRHRIPWIRESCRADGIEASADACVIDSIQW